MRENSIWSRKNYKRLDIKDIRKLFKIGRFSNESFNSYIDCLTSKGATPEKYKLMNENASSESPSVVPSMIPTYVASHEPSIIPSNASSNCQPLPPTYIPSFFLTMTPSYHPSIIQSTEPTTRILESPTS